MADIVWGGVGWKVLLHGGGGGKPAYHPLENPTPPSLRSPHPGRDHQHQTDPEEASSKGRLSFLFSFFFSSRSWTLKKKERNRCWNWIGLNYHNQRIQKFQGWSDYFNAQPSPSLLCCTFSFPIAHHRLYNLLIYYISHYSLSLPLSPLPSPPNVNSTRARIFVFNLCFSSI